MSTEAVARSEGARPPLRGICLVVTGNETNQLRRNGATRRSPRLGLAPLSLPRWVRHANPSQEKVDDAKRER